MSYKISKETCYQSYNYGSIPLLYFGTPAIDHKCIKLIDSYSLKQDYISMDISLQIECNCLLCLRLKKILPDL